VPRKNFTRPSKGNAAPCPGAGYLGPPPESSRCGVLPGSAASLYVNTRQLLSVLGVLFGQSIKACLGISSGYRLTCPTLQVSKTGQFTQEVAS
jgi:hypothetical protein